MSAMKACDLCKKFIFSLIFLILCMFFVLFTLDHLNQEILFHSSHGLLDTAIFHNLSRNVLGDLISNYFLFLILKRIYN